MVCDGFGRALQTIPQYPRHDCEDRNLCCNASLSQINPITHLLSEQNEGKTSFSASSFAHNQQGIGCITANSFFVSLVICQFFHNQVKYFTSNVLAHFLKANYKFFLKTYFFFPARLVSDWTSREAFETATGPLLENKPPPTRIESWSCFTTTNWSLTLPSPATAFLFTSSDTR